MQSCFIDDGYSVTTTIPAVSGLHGPLTVTYRPALAEERYRFQTEQAKADARGQVRTISALIDAHLESWDARDGRGTAVPKNATNAAKLHPNLIGKLLDLILGYSAADEVADAKN